MGPRIARRIGQHAQPLAPRPQRGQPEHGIRSGRRQREPDVLAQANMSVDAALTAWPRLQDTGLTLGAPAVAVAAFSRFPLITSARR